MQDEHITSAPAEQEPAVEVQDESWRHGFTIVPNVVLRNREMSPGAKLAYGVLLSYAWQKDYCFPGQTRMAEDLGVSARSVRNYLKELQDLGIVIIKQRGLHKTNVYVLPRLIGDPRPIVDKSNRYPVDKSR